MSGHGRDDSSGSDQPQPPVRRLMVLVDKDPCSVYALDTCVSYMKPNDELLIVTLVPLLTSDNTPEEVGVLSTDFFELDNKKQIEEGQELVTRLADRVRIQMPDIKNKQLELFVLPLKEGTV